MRNQVVSTGAMRSLLAMPLLGADPSTICAGAIKAQRRNDDMIWIKGAGCRR
jgi:hypothetical protein